MSKNKNNKPHYVKKKSMAVRILMIALAVLMVVGFVMIPLRAEERDDSLTVRSFETGRLADAISEAANGTDYNFIKNVAVLSGTLNAADFGSLAAIPNLEILELAGTETENGIIPENALPSRNQLSLITLPKNTVEIGANAFSNNKKLVKVTMPATVTKIDDFAFAYCEALENIPVSEKVEYIGESAFQDCKAIKEFVIPVGITEIYPNTFSKCGFESISIGPNVTKIDTGVFADCNGLKDIYVYPEAAPVLDGDVFRNVSANIHCYADSEESYQSWLMQNMTVTPDLTGEYTLSAEVPEENNEQYPETTAAEISKTEESVSETDAETEETTTSEAVAVPASAESNSGGLSVGVVVVIVIMAVIIAVLATILVMNSKKNKN